MAYRDRIKEVRKVKGTDLLANPKNWRIHPEAQLTGLHSVLSSVGKVGALIAWESPEGLMLIDGHGRVELNPEEEWTVLVLDIQDEKEVEKVLATYDLLAEVADIDFDRFEGLFSELFNADKDSDLSSLLVSLSASKGVVLDPEVLPSSLDAFFAQQKDAPLKQKEEPLFYCPHCGKLIEDRK